MVPQRGTAEESGKIPVLLGSVARIDHVNKINATATKKQRKGNGI